MSLSRTKYIMYSIAAALIAAGESFKSSADNIPASAEADGDGVIDDTGADANPGTNATPPAFDSAGLPWDERIHSGSKSIKTDGTWTKKKGATPPLVAQVEAELRAKLSTGAITQPGVQLPSIGTVTLPGVPTLAPKLTNYQQLCAFLAANTGPGKTVDEAWVNSSLTAQGTSLAALAADEAGSEAWLAAFKKVLTPAAA